MERVAKLQASLIEAAMQLLKCDAAEADKQLWQLYRLLRIIYGANS